MTSKVRPKSKGKKKDLPENDQKFGGGEGKPKLSQQDRFWRAARRYLNGYQNPFDWMNQDDGIEAAQESQEDYIDSMEDFYRQNPAGTPGGGSYIGDETATGQPQASPYAQQGMTEQLGAMPGMEGFFPPTPPQEPPVVSGAPGADLALANSVPPPQPVSGQPVTSGQPVAYNGAPPDQVALAQKYGQQYGVDPGVLLAIAKHETQFGEAGLGRKGLTLGYGAFDSGPTMKWAGPENQYRAGAERLSEWGVKGINDITGGKAASWATDPNWEKGIASAYQALAPQLGTPAAAVNGITGSTDVFTDILNGIEAGKIDPKILDTLGPGLTQLADNTAQAADDIEQGLGVAPEDEEEDE